MTEATSISTAGPLRWRLWLGTAAALLAFVLYLNTLHNPWVFDDHRTILTNTSLASLADFRAVGLHDVTRPIVNLSYALDRHFSGTAPFGFHLTNVLLHVINVWLLFLLTWRLVEDRARRYPDPRHAIRAPVAAFVAASLFAVHPMMTESVGYISGRSELLTGVFFLCAMLCARRWMLGAGARWWLLTAGLWVASMLSKEVGVMLPLVLFVYDRWILDDDAHARRRRFRRLHLPLAGAAILVAVVRGVVLEVVEHPEYVDVRWQSPLEELNVVARYVGLMLVPTGQTIFHELPQINRLSDPRALAGLAVIGLIAGLAWTARRSYPVAAFGALWFLLLLVPSSALFVLGHGQSMAEHRVYLASGGLFLAAGALGGRLATLLAHKRRAVRWIAGGICAVELVSLSGRTLLRNAVWADPVALWREASRSRSGRLVLANGTRRGAARSRQGCRGGRRVSRGRTAAPHRAERLLDARSDPRPVGPAGRGRRDLPPTPGRGAGLDSHLDGTRRGGDGVGGSGSCAPAFSRDDRAGSAGHHGAPMALQARGGHGPQPRRGAAHLRGDSAHRPRHIRQ